MSAVIVQEKDPDDDITYPLDSSERLVQEALRSHDFALGAFARAFGLDTGWYYECTSAGRTGERAPTRGFPRAGGETITDGSLEWTCRHPSDATLAAISSIEVVEDAGLTVTTNVIGFVIYVTVSGGVDGQDYAITLRITPSTGDAFDQTLVVPVRAQ